MTIEYLRFDAEMLKRMANTHDVPWLKDHVVFNDDTFTFIAMDGDEPASCFTQLPGR